MYTLDTSTGIVTRDSDGAQCAPAQSITDANFVSYHAWVVAGNAPTITASVVLQVPQSISSSQLRRILNATGLRAQAEAAVAAASQDVKDEWQFTSDFFRYNPVLLTFAAQLGMSDAQVDQLFIAASAL